MATTDDIFDSEKVVEELTVGHEIMTQLHSLLQEPTTVDRVRGELICNLSRVVKAFEVGISILKQNLDSTDESQDSAASGVVVMQKSKNGKRAKSSDSGNSDACRDRKMRKCANSRKIVSNSPFGDGYQWRKYGEKRIQNGAHSRTYYRCTNSGCSARKQVQQRDSGTDHMPLYDVTYINDHTCGVAPDSATLSLTATLPSSESQMLIFNWNETMPALGKGKQEKEHLLPSCSYQNSSCSEQIFSPQSTDTSFSSVDPFGPDQTIAESLIHEFSMTTSENDQIDIISHTCSSPEGPWFGFDASTYIGWDK